MDHLPRSRGEQRFVVDTNACSATTLKVEHATPTARAGSSSSRRRRVRGHVGKALHNTSTHRSPDARRSRDPSSSNAPQFFFARPSSQKKSHGCAAIGMCVRQLLSELLDVQDGMSRVSFSPMRGRSCSGRHRLLSLPCGHDLERAGFGTAILAVDAACSVKRLRAAGAGEQG